MAKTTAADYTFHPWRDNGGDRILLSKAGWKKPLSWNRKAAEIHAAWSEDCAEKESLTWPGKPERPRVFCPCLTGISTATGAMFEDWDGIILNHRGLRLFRCDECGICDGCRNVGETAWLTMADIRSDLFQLLHETPCLDWIDGHGESRKVTRSVLFNG